jgi:hypothetical protein
VRRLEAALDVLSDPKLLEGLERADSQPDEAARPLEEVLRGGVPRLRLKRVAEAQFPALPDNAREEVELALLQIAADPRNEGTPLVGRLHGRWRRRVGG